MLNVIHQACTAIQTNGPAPAGIAFAIKTHLRLGLTQILAQCATQRQWILQSVGHGRLGKLHQSLWYGTTMLHSSLLRVAVHGLTHRVDRVFSQTLQQLGCQLAAIGRAKTNGVRHTLTDCDAIVRITRRQVEHVARVEYEFFLGFKVRQDFERHIGHQAQVLLSSDTPMALAVGLQQKYVVTVKVRPDAAAIRGIAHHQVVQARIGDKAKLVHQRMHAFVVQIHALQQYRPTRLLERGQCGAGKGPMAKLPDAFALNALNIRRHD